MNEEEIKKIAVDTLQEIQTTYDWIERDCLNRYVNSIFDLRKFTQDIITLSITIVGIIIPLLINFQIPVNKDLLLGSVLLFSIEIIFGIILRFYVLKREADNWSVIQKEREEECSQIVAGLNELKNNPSENLLKQWQDGFVNRFQSKNKKETKSIVANKFNIDCWFFGLFIIAFLLFIFSLYPILK